MDLSWIRDLFSDPIDNFRDKENILRYANRPFPLSSGFLRKKIEPPSYPDLIELTKGLPYKAIAYDVWARGNYTRRIVSNQQANKCPLLVPFTRIEELCGTYRRLAALGIPLEFIYCGPLRGPYEVRASLPLNELSGGWGYLVADGHKISEKQHLTVFGNAKLLPESIIDWLHSDASGAFSRGDIFVSPAELVGIDPLNPSAGTTALRDMSNGISVVDSDSVVEALSRFELPSIEGMSHKDFDRFLSDHSDQLINFRNAVGGILTGGTTDKLPELVARLEDELRALQQSQQYDSYRKTITKLGGTLVTVGAATAAAVSAAPETAVPVAATTGAASVAAVLIELWRQRIDRAEKKATHPFQLAVEFGWEKSPKIRRGPIDDTLKYRVGRISGKSPAELSDFHWLCPPTEGFLLVLANEKDRQTEKAAEEGVEIARFATARLIRRKGR